MIDAATGLQILSKRGLVLRPVKGGLWIAETASGGRLHRDPQSSPLLALELAEQTLVSAEERAASTNNDRAMEALTQGKFFIRPRTLPDNSTVFDGFLPDGSPIPEAKDKATFSESVQSCISFTKTKTIKEPK